MLVGGEKTNHKQLFGIVPGMDRGQICLCVAFFLGRKGKHINKLPGNQRKVPGQSRGHPVKHFFLLTCFRASFFPFCSLCCLPLFLPFSRHLFDLSSPWKSALFCRERVQSRAWRWAALGCTSPQSSGRKFLPEICVKNFKKVSMCFPVYSFFFSGTGWGNLTSQGWSVGCFLGRPL